ncbi:class I SAM-dependent methyltransferase [Desulfosediminicola flagellatus]|uniref:class I SAM-dependent methyltransferase n=1 Tax=Desulfosediminicola flagellatus TaxID=2569541 RepID=UPI00142EAED7|nr:class I SAM-dependent methyltransferase [Desulfosediminicola flagellatus]
MKQVKLFESRVQERELLETHIRMRAANAAPLRILEAGCGRNWPLELAGIEYSLVGVDTNEKALEIRKTQIGDLDEVIVGDLRTVEFEEGTFDVIYNSFVLEHVVDARKVLDNFHKWLKPSGILIVRIPDRDSVYGYFTRTMPFFVHVMFARHVKGFRQAGRPGFGPYPTYHEPVVSRRGMHEFCQDNDCLLMEEYGQGYYLEWPGLASRLMRLFVATASLISLGNLPWRYNNLTYIVQKDGGDLPGQEKRPNRNVAESHG